MKNIYLVGFMGTGKTSVGKIIANKLTKEFIEMDAAIENAEGIPITDIFKTKGEPYFRQMETKILKQLAVKSDLVISCGGGLICNQENADLMKETGTIFTLTASSSTIYERTKNSCGRPLLNVTDPKKAIDDLLTKRKPFYNQAHFSIATDDLTPEQIADDILKRIKQ